ncbi:MAG: TolC family protein, partial [Gammaproteobacteria bacterium]|nr:TolC family protein [Gammaproteobacteria bacterium]
MRRGTAVASALLLLAGCTVGPDYRAPAPNLPERFATGAGAGSVPPAAVPDAAWWQGFNDPVLTTLINRAAASNRDLRIAVANLRASRSLLTYGQLSRLPIITAEASVTREKQSTLAGNPFALDDDFYDAGFDATWEIDLLGRSRRSIEALVADYESEQALYRDTLRSVIAEVARTYVQLRGTQYRLAVARNNTRNQEETFGLTRALLEGGRGTDLDIARAEAQLETTRASTGSLEAAEIEAINRLAVLAGGRPDE